MKISLNKPQSIKLSQNDADSFVQFMTDLSYFNNIFEERKELL